MYIIIQFCFIEENTQSENIVLYHRHFVTKNSNFVKFNF